MKTVESENTIEYLVEYTERYSITTFELLRLKLLRQSTFITSLLITRIVVVSMYIFCFVIGSIGAAIWTGSLLGEMYLGFLIVAAFYLVAGIIFHNYLYRWIKKPISDLLIRQAQMPQ